MNSDVKDTRGFKYYFGSVLAVLIILFFGKVVSPWGAVTETGVSCIGVFLGIIIAVLFTGEVLWPTVIAMVSLTLCGYYTSFSEAVSNVFGHSLVYNFFLITALVSAMNSVKTGEAIVSLLLTRKFFYRKPLLFSFSILLIFAFAVNFMNPVGALLVAFPLFDVILDYAGIDRKDKYARFMNVGIFLAVNIGCAFRGAVMPDFRARIEFFNIALKGTGIAVSLGRYTVFSIVTTSTFFALYVTAMKVVFNCDFGKLSDNDFNNIPEIRESAKLNKNQIIYLCGFLAFALFGLISESTATLSKITPYGVLGIVCVFLSFLNMTNDEGKKVRLFDFAAYLKTVDWNIAMSLGIFSVIGTAVGSDKCGIKSWITDIVNKVLSNNGAAMVTLICIVGISAITHVLNNNATATIFASLAAPVATPFVVAGQMNPAELISCITICAQSGFLTMAACGTAPVLHHRPGIDNKFIWTYGLFMEILFIFVTVFMYFVFSLV